jgi:exodeoxyribonuclease VII small subunit
LTDEEKTGEELSFGDALEELEGIVAALENGQLELEDSLAKYERGVKLLRLLQAKLADAQQKVTMLIGELEAESAEAEAPTAESHAGDASG